MTDSMEEFRTPHTISTVLAEGLYDEGSSLHVLLGFPNIMQIVWEHVMGYWRKEVINFAQPDIILKFDDALIELKERRGSQNYYPPPGCEVDTCEESPQPFYLSPIFSWELSDDSNYSNYSFPPPSDINIRMMPFIAGEKFEETKLPRYLRPYWEMIQRCLQPEMARNGEGMEYWPRDKVPSEMGKVYYLTIEERELEAGSSQGRPGLHVESPGIVKIKNEDPAIGFEGKGSAQPYVGNGLGSNVAHFSRSRTDTNTKDYAMRGGIYLATSVGSSYRGWDCGLEPEAVYRLGDVEHLRPFLPGPAVELEAGNIYWMTDRTPHESLPLTEGGMGQFFRLVTSQVSLWYSDHYTPNPMGVLPDSSITRIVSGDRFGEEDLEVVHVSTMMKLKNKLRRLKHLPMKAKMAKEYWDSVQIMYDSD